MLSFRMSSVDLSKDYVSMKLLHYKKEKRLQGFKLHKSRVQFKKMKTAVRLLQLGREPSAESREYLQVNSNV